MIFCGDENFKNIFIENVNVYRYSNLIKADKYFRTDCCLVINLKQTWPPCELSISCTSTTAESRAKIWYQ